MTSIAVALRAVPGPLFRLRNPHETLTTVRHLGYDAVDVAVGSADEARRAELGSKVADAGLRLGGLLTGLAHTEDGLSLSNPRTALAARDRLAGLIEIAAEMNAAIVVGLMAGVLPDAPADRAVARGTLVASLADAAGRARQAGVAVLLEPINRYESNVAPTADEATALINEAGGGIGLMLDMFHANIEEADPCGAAQRHASRAGLVQLSDSNRRMPGDGHFPIAAWVAALRDAGYHGDFAVEADFGANPVSDAARALAACRALGL